MTNSRQVTMLGTLIFAIVISRNYGQELCPVVDGELDISAMNLMSINGDTFEIIYDCAIYASNIEKLDLSNNYISNIDGNSFAIFYELRTLNLSYNNIESVPRNVFSSLTSLKELDLSNNKLTHLEAGLIDLVNLETVRFNNNNISVIEPGIVSDINVALTYFNMNNNSLRYFDPWPYLTYQSATLNTIRNFYLEYNQIESLTNYMNWTYNLEYPYEVEVHLQFNRIQTVSTDTLRQYDQDVAGANIYSVFRTYQINITNNPFLCDCRLYDMASWVRGGIFKYIEIEKYRYRCTEPALTAGWDVLHDLSLDFLVCNVTDSCPAKCFCQDRPHDDTFLMDCTDASLTEMPEVIPETDRSKIEMILDRNQISRIRNTTYLSKLVTLSLALNKIERLEKSILQRMSLDVYLNLKKNNINTLPKYLQNFNYSSVKLGGNPLKCDCGSMWLVTWINLYEEGDETLTCEKDNDVHVVSNLTLDLINCTNELFIIISASLAAALLVLLLLSIMSLRCPYETKVIIHKLSRGYIHPGKKYEVDIDALKEVDIYAVFDDNCKDVIGWFRFFTRKLNKKKPTYSILNPARFMEPGSEYENISKWVGRSKRLLVILSENIFENEWRIQEIEEAEHLLTEAEAQKRALSTTNSRISYNNRVCVVNLEGDEDKSRMSNNVANKADCVRACNFDDDRPILNAPRIIYIIFNDHSFQEKLQQEPWKSRLAGKVVLSPNETFFWSKLRYELPPTGGGRGDGNFMPFARKDSQNVKQTKLDAGATEEFFGRIHKNEQIELREIPTAYGNCNCLSTHKNKIRRL